jgi:hypothetical protein
MGKGIGIDTIIKKINYTQVEHPKSENPKI